MTISADDHVQSPSLRSRAADPLSPAGRADVTTAGVTQSAGRTAIGAGSGATSVEIDHGARLRSRLRFMRSSGGILTVAAGPLAGIIAWRAAGMSVFEACSLAFLVSAWLGPKLLGTDEF